MHFIHEINWFEWLLHKTSFFFKNFNFPDFRSIECIFRFYWKYVKKFGLNLLGSIGARSIECIFRLIEPQFRLIEIQKLSLLKSFTFTCSSLFQKNFRLFLSFSLWPIQSKGFLFFFFHKFLQGFCSQALVRPLYPFFFNLITCFMHFSLKFSNIGNLGFLFLGCF